MAKYYYGDNAFEDPDYDESYTGNYMKFDRNWYWKTYKNSKHVWTFNLPPVAPMIDDNWNIYRDSYLRDGVFTYGKETFKTQDLCLHVNYCFTYNNSQEETGISPYTRSEAIGNVYVNYTNMTYNVEPDIQYRVYAPVDSTNMYRYVKGQDYANLFFHSDGFENGVNNFSFLRYTKDATNMFLWSEIDWGDQAWFSRKYSYNYQTLEEANSMFKGANINIAENVWIPYGLRSGAEMFMDVKWTGAETANSGLVLTSRMENCYRLYYGCNFVTDFVDERWEPSTRDYSGMFCNAKNLNNVVFNSEHENTIVPVNANNVAYMYYGTNLIDRNVYIESDEIDNVCNFLNFPRVYSSDRLDVWLNDYQNHCTSITNETIYKKTTTDSILGYPITWTIKDDLGYYYNTKYNIYIHYFVPVTYYIMKDQSVLKAYIDNVAVSMEGMYDE